MVNTRGGGDSPFLLQRTLDMAENLRHGIFPVRWMAHAAYDLGYPFFNHYAALPYYLSGGLTVLGFSPLVAIQATQTFGFILAALTIALWAEHIFKSWTAAFVASAAYTFAPFHMVNVYVRGDSLSEFYAFVWYPLILWTFDRVAERPTRGRIIAASLAYGALILTHNTSALVFSPFALLYAMVRITKYAVRITNHESSSFSPVYRLPFMVYLIIPFVLAFLLTAWFWLPAIAETKYGQMGPEFTAGYFHYSNHFRGLDLVQRTFVFDYSVAPRTEDAGPFAMGLVQAGLAVVGVGSLMANGKRQMANGELANRRTGEPVNERIGELRMTNYESRVTNHESHFTFYVLFALALATFMITPFSRLLWDYLPLLEITQFPWRFLSIQALFTAMVTGAIVVNRRISKSENLKVIVAVVVCGTLMAAALLGLHPERLRIAGEDVTWENLLFYETFTGNIGTTIRYEYLPRDVSPRPYISEAVVDGALRLIADGGGLAAWKLVKRTPVKQIWQVTVNTGGAIVAFPLNGWPGWQAEMDGAPVNASPMHGSGRLTISLPAGEHTVTLRLHNTPLRTVAEILSLLAIIGLITWAFTGQMANGAWRMASYASRITHHASRITHHASRITHHAPRITHHASHITHHTSRITHHASHITHHASHITHHASHITHHASHITHPIPRLPFTVFLLLAVSTILPALLHHVPGASAMFFDFNQMPYPHAGPIDFGTARLERIALATTTAQPGDTLTVQHTWATMNATPLTGTLRLVLPAEPRHGVPYALAEKTFTLPCTGVCATTLTLPDDLARGLYLLELRLFGANAELSPRTVNGSGMGTLYIGAVRIPHGPPLAATASTLATFTDLTLHAVEPHQPDPTTLRLKMTWSTPGTPRNWTLSLRLLDATGRQIVQQDIQPGYGYLPTSLWLPGETVTDYPVFTLPEGLAPGDYTLRVITYLLGTMEGGGQADIPIRLTAATLYDPRNACCELTRKGATILCQAAGVALLGTDLPEQLVEGNPLAFHAEWNAIAAPTADLNARWEVLDSVGNVVGRAEGTLAAGSLTSAWPWHAWVRAPIYIDLPPVLLEGAYSVRLTLLEGDAAQAVCTFRERFNVTPRPRTFEMPAIPHPLEADFGGEIRLRGYDLHYAKNMVTLTLWWQAMTAPQRDYKRFVHLYDPATEAIVAQDDAMPRAWTYPTTWWIAGEVVSETVTLDVRAVLPGAYRLGVGWYDPVTLDRLPATDAAGRPHPLNRVTLDIPLER